MASSHASNPPRIVVGEQVHQLKALVEHIGVLAKVGLQVAGVWVLDLALQGGV